MIIILLYITNNGSCELLEKFVVIPSCNLIKILLVDHIYHGTKLFKHTNKHCIIGYMQYK